VETPVINSYLFVRIDAQQMPTLYATKGFVAFVADKGKPAIIPASQIEAMRLTVENKLLYTLEQNSLNPGESIRITSRPLINVIGEIIQIRQQSRLLLRIPQLGYALSVDIAGFTFEKIQ
jgi:transcription antitermination factor NusG